MTDVRGPITIISGKKRRVTFIEVPNDINGMVDAAKVADLVLLLIDAHFGFEMVLHTALTQIFTNHCTGNIRVFEYSASARFP
jgi:hypothetical protein